MTSVDRDAAARRIRALIDLGRVKAAVTEVMRCLAQDPKEPGLLELLGLCQIRLADPNGARATLRAACVEAPDRPHIHYLLGFACRDAGDAEGAVAGFLEAVRLSPDEPVYLRALAELLADRRVLDEALGLARRAVAAAPDTASNHVTLGYVASTAGNLDLARAEYRCAVGLDPLNATAWNNLGCIEMASGDRLSARERFREALRIDPGAERAQRNLALVSPIARPRPIYDDFEFLVGEALRELRDAGRLMPAIRLLALVQAAGRTAVRSAITGRAEAAGAGSRVGVAAGAAVATAALRALGPASLVPVGVGAAIAGVGWLVAAKRVTPLRRKYLEHIAAARSEWQSNRTAWLEHRMSRDARDRSIDRLLERLCVALDAEPVPAQSARIDGE